jgi:KipI family sensor histidine kinase inhibitor
VRVVPYGEHALFVELGLGSGDADVRRTLAVARALRARFPRAEVVLGTGTIVVTPSPPEREVDEVVSRALVAEPTAEEPTRLHRVRAVYDGPDLDAVAAQAGLTRDEVIRRHCDREYIVELIGFLPGFAYLGALDPALVLPRRATPRPRVAKGSLAIAGVHTGIYPLSSPGGWHLIGRAVDVEPFDPHRSPPVLFAPGDRVRFEVSGG